MGIHSPAYYRMDSHSWKDVNVTKIEGENNDIIRKIKPYFVTTFHILNLTVLTNTL